MLRVLSLLFGAWLLLLGGPMASANAQTPPCRSCQDQGTVPCSKHGKLLPAEQGVLACSVAMECKACLGALQVDCKHCASPEREASLADRQRLLQEWLQQRRQQVDALTGRDPYAHLRTAHFDLASTLKGATVGTDKLDPHARLHLYGQRLEALFTLFTETLQLPAEDLPDRMLICLSEEARDHGVIGPRLTGMGGPNSVGLKLMGPTYVFSMWPERRSLPNDEAVHRYVVHNVTHLLLSMSKPALYLGNKKHGWLDEGVAHWFEDRVTEKCTTYCYEEIALQAGAGWKGGKWRPAVRRLVDAGEAATFAALSGKHSDELLFVDHALAFAYVDFLLAERGGAKFRDFLRAVKGGAETRDALPAAFGFTPLSIDAEFQSWVKRTYSPLPPR